MKVMTYLSTMMDLFCKCKNRIPEYFKEGRKFWTFHQGWKLITITYKRSNHIFYTIEGDEKEYCIPCDCMMSGLCMMKIKMLLSLKMGIRLTYTGGLMPCLGIMIGGL